MASPVSSALLLLFPLLTLQQCQAWVSREGTVSHSRKEHHLAMLVEVWIFLNLYLYTVLFLYVRTISSSSLSGTVSASAIQNSVFTSILGQCGL
ncbi:hypothetical protein ACRRTK_008561 [Alexandromys fortis]